MKITGGKYKGRNIEARDEKILRPTSARTREAIFNILRHGRFLSDERFICDDNPSLVDGRRVLDIFCGTGALGLEALSRGAVHLTLVDQNRDTLSIARKNVEHLGENATFIRSDSTMLPVASIPCELVFIDPPYGRNLVIPALNSLVKGKWLTNGAVIVIEHGKRDSLKSSTCVAGEELDGGVSNKYGQEQEYGEGLPENFQLLDDRVHDKTRITILQYAS